MKKILLLLVLLSLLLPNGYAQRSKNPRFLVGIDLLMNVRAVNLPLSVTGPQGDKLQVHPGSNVAAFFQKEYYGTTASPMTPDVGVIFQFPQSPMVFRVGCAWEGTAFTMEYPHVIRERWCKIVCLKPNVGVRIPLTDHTKKGKVPVALAGVFYSIPVKTWEGAFYHPKAENTGFAKGGFEGEIGMGITQWAISKSDLYLEISLLYRHYFYNMFNQQYQDKDGEKPFDGLTTRCGDIRLRLVMGGFLN